MAPEHLKCSWASFGFISVPKPIKENYLIQLEALGAQTPKMLLCTCPLWCEGQCPLQIQLISFPVPKHTKGNHMIQMETLGAQTPQMLIGKCP